MALDRNQIYLFLNTLNSEEGYYRHKKIKIKMTKIQKYILEESKNNMGVIR